ncbi:MAG: hypothetical protein ACJA2Z_000184 [Candidatus Paceibacteria bacterium]|jgi:hypothetical protein
MRENHEKMFEELSALEHEQWMIWAKEILSLEDISPERRERWEQYFVPYDELTDSVKNSDRVFARKSLEIFKKYQKENK